MYLFLEIKNHLNEKAVANSDGSIKTNLKILINYKPYTSTN